MTYKDPQTAFVQAINAGRLSNNRGLDIWAGNYMYMGTSAEGKDLFKHSVTRQYLA